MKFSRLTLLLCSAMFLSSCVTYTYTAGELTLGNEQDSTAVVLFGARNKDSAQSIYYGGTTTLFNLSNRSEYQVSHSLGYDFYKLRIIHLPPGIYALVDFEFSIKAGSMTSTYSETKSPMEAPWFVAVAGQRLYLGSIIFDAPSNQFIFEDDRVDAQRLLSEIHHDTSFTYTPFIVSAEKKAELEEKWNLSIRE